MLLCYYQSSKMICKLCDGTPIGKLFKMNKNKKIMRFECKTGQNEEK